jgi:TonB family protein
LQLRFFGHGSIRSGSDSGSGAIRHHGRWENSLLVALATLSGFVAPVSAQTDGASEYQIKAAYLYNFAKSAEWPEKNLPGGAPLLIGIVGGDEEFVDTMKKTVSGKTAGTHPVTVKRAESDQEIGLCHLVFFRASTGHKRTESAIVVLPNSSILSVGEDSFFLRQGGMINLVLKHGMVRFEVNRASLDRAGIRLGAALLALANSEDGAPNASVAESDTSAPGAGGESRRLKVGSPPEYPEIAKRMSIKGVAQVEASVRRDGTVKDVKIIGGHPVLADALAKTVMGWQYEPAAKESQVVVRFVFDQ